MPDIGNFSRNLYASRGYPMTTNSTGLKKTAKVFFFPIMF